MTLIYKEFDNEMQNFIQKNIDWVITSIKIKNGEKVPGLRGGRCKGYQVPGDKPLKDIDYSKVKINTPIEVYNAKIFDENNVPIKIKESKNYDNHITQEGLVMYLDKNPFYYISFVSHNSNIIGEILFYKSVPDNIEVIDNRCCYKGDEKYHNFINVFFPEDNLQLRINSSLRTAEKLAEDKDYEIAIIRIKPSFFSSPKAIWLKDKKENKDTIIPYFIMPEISYKIDICNLEEYINSFIKVNQFVK